MNQKEVIEKLKDRVNKDAVAKDVCYVWAMRKRARGQVTTEGLTQRMLQEGFQHEASDYNNFLKFISTLGLGNLETLGKNRVKLKDVKVKLQSIGAAAAGGEVKLDGYKKRARYEAISPAKPERKDRRHTEVNKAWKAAPETKTAVGLAYFTGEKTVYIPVPQELKPNEVAELVTRLQGRTGV